MDWSPGHFPFETYLECHRNLFWFCCSRQAGCHALASDWRVPFWELHVTRLNLVQSQPLLQLPQLFYWKLWDDFRLGRSGEPIQPSQLIQSIGLIGSCEDWLYRCSIVTCHVVKVRLCLQLDSSTRFLLLHHSSAWSNIQCVYEALAASQIVLCF